jgi:hypothetical protein
MTDIASALIPPSIEPSRFFTETTTNHWRNLSLELDSWLTSGRVASFWWRDDDVADITPAFVRLRSLVERFEVPLALGVIPSAATPALAAEVNHWVKVAVLQHGEMRGEGGSSNRPAEGIVAEIEQGRSRMEKLFAERFLPILVPPWERLTPGLVSALPAMGYRGLSAVGGTRFNVGELIQVNAHVDVVNRRGGEFAGERNCLEAAVSHLRRRRLGGGEAEEATGLLTHHLMMDEAAWHFVERFLLATLPHPAVRWLNADEVFRCGVI